MQVANKLGKGKLRRPVITLGEKGASLASWLTQLLLKSLHVEAA